MSDASLEASADAVIASDASTDTLAVDAVCPDRDNDGHRDLACYIDRSGEQTCPAGG